MKREATELECHEFTSGSLCSVFLRYAGCESLDQFLFSYKPILLLIVLNVVCFHSGKLLFLIALVVFFCIGLVYDLFCFFFNFWLKKNIIFKIIQNII